MPNTYTPLQMAEAIASIGVATLQEKELTITQSGEQTITPDSGYDGLASVALTVDVPTGGGSVAEEKDVNFIDYDGTIVHSYTAIEFAALSKIPENPTHEGLTAQGWNWNLNDAQAYVAEYGKLWIGQMYITDDGKTRIYIHLEKGRTSPYLGIAVKGTADVDWGDGTAHTTVTGTSISTVINTLHNYPEATGDYIITIDVTGSMELLGSGKYGSQLLYKDNTVSEPNHVYQSMIQRVEIGNGVTSIGNNAFYYCTNLASITIPDSVTSIGNTVFRACYNLASITIPDSVTSIGSSPFTICHITSVAIPNSVTNFESQMFYNCSGLASVTVPDSMTSIGYQMFNACYSLASVTVPAGVTSIGIQAFYNCYSLTSITIPNTVTNIENNAFNNCYGLGFIRFEPTTPPTVVNSNAFTNIPTDCIIYIPSGTLSAYTSATNYPSSSTYTYVEY